MTSSFFPDSHHFVSNVGSVVTATNYYQHGGGSDRDWALELLRENISEGAMHDSNERCDPPTCDPDTRKAVQEDIFSWMSHGDARPQTVMWMSGPAGCGKTAIAGSVAEACIEAGLLAASFFCSSFAGSLSRRSKRHVIPTLAYQLIQADASGTLRQHILSSIRADPTIFTKRLRDQCRTLLLKPLQQLFDQGLILHIPRVIIIDGLDEIERVGSRKVDRQRAIRENEADQVEVLNALLSIVSNPVFPLRILICSRPERGIREFFDGQLADGLTIRLFLDNKYNPDADIELFLRSKFASIRRRYCDIPLSWPTDNDIKTLVYNASGQFIYAATVIRFVQDGFNPPTDQLGCVLQLRFTGTGNPLETLDALYRHVLMSSPDPTLAAEWIFWAASGGSGFGKAPARYVRQLLETSSGQAEHLLGNLSSLVHIPAPDDISSPYRIYHKSLMDYLGDDARGGAIFPRRGSPNLAQISYLRVLKGEPCLIIAWIYKGPAVPVGSSEIFYFFTSTARHWWWWVDSLLLPVGPDQGPNGILARCDVPWWMHTITTTQPDSAAENIAISFRCCHCNCTDHRTCNVICRHWRQGILAFCRANGWSIPSDADLHRERLYDARERGGDNDGEGEELEEDEDDYDEDGMFTFVKRFRPPGPSIAHLLSAVDGGGCI